MAAFPCPFCKALKTITLYTRPGHPYKRYRRCEECKKRFKTYEGHIESDIEEYIKLIAVHASDRMVERMLEALLRILHGVPMKNALMKALREEAGVVKGAKNPATMFR